MAASSGRWRRALGGGPTVVAVLLFGVMYGIYSARTDAATTVFGLTSLLNNAIVLAIASAGLTLVVLTGEFDLSSIAVIAVCNCGISMLSRMTVHRWRCAAA